jgi:hypothetical protein
MNITSQIGKIEALFLSKIEKVVLGLGASRYELRQEAVELRKLQTEYIDSSCGDLQIRTFHLLVGQVRKQLSNEKSSVEGNSCLSTSLTLVRSLKAERLRVDAKVQNVKATVSGPTGGDEKQCDTKKCDMSKVIDAITTRLGYQYSRDSLWCMMESTTLRVHSLKNVLDVQTPKGLAKTLDECLDTGCDLRIKCTDDSDRLAYIRLCSFSQRSMMLSLEQFGQQSYPPDRPEQNIFVFDHSISILRRSVETTHQQNVGYTILVIMQRTSSGDVFQISCDMTWLKSMIDGNDTLKYVCVPIRLMKQSESKTESGHQLMLVFDRMDKMFMIVDPNGEMGYFGADNTNIIQNTLHEIFKETGFTPEKLRLSDSYKAEHDTVSLDGTALKIFFPGSGVSLNSEFKGKALEGGSCVVTTLILARLLCIFGSLGRFEKDLPLFEIHQVYESLLKFKSEKDYYAWVRDHTVMFDAIIRRIELETLLKGITEKNVRSISYADVFKLADRIGLVDMELLRTLV